MLRRSSLKRTPMKRGTSELKRTRLRRRSKQQQAKYDIRNPMTEKMIADNTPCAICPLIFKAWFGMKLEHHPRRYASCSIEHVAEHYHERRKRGQAGSIINRRNMVPSCDWSNGWCEEWPDDATAMGMVLHEGDDEWDAMSKRHDRELKKAEKL